MDFFAIPPMTDYLFAQIIGFIAMGIGFWAFQLKNQKAMFLTSELSTSFWVAHYFLLGAYTGSFVLAVAIVRTMVVLFVDKKWTIPVLLIALTLNLAFCFLSSETYWYKYLPFICACVFSVALYFNDDFMKSRLLTILSTVLWLTYGVLTHSFAEVTESIIIIISVMLGIWRHHGGLPQKVA